MTDRNLTLGTTQPVDIDVDATIVGYGPTGMTLAALLGQAGHTVLVLERYPGLYNLPRAAAFDDETMRTFQKLGVAERMLPGTNVQRGYVWVNGHDDVLLDIEFDNPGTNGWPAQFMMYQPHMETVLDERVGELATVDVRRGMTAVEIAQDAGQAYVTAVDVAGAPYRARSRFVVGSDGGNSLVRTAVGADLDDYGFFENWLVCDFRLRRDLPALPTFRQVCNPAEPIAIVNIGPGFHRFSFRLESRTDRDKVTEPDQVWRRVAGYLDPRDAEIIRVANYTFRSCIANTWRSGRLLLAGDAAHQMPPFLAQGMVSGIRDARNLAWKIDMILAGHDDSLLDSYQAEREPHVRFITEKAIELGRVQTMRDEALARERDTKMLAARAANDEPDKLRYPPLTGGLIAGDGTLFPQALVSGTSRTALLDDIVGTGWLLVTAGRDVTSSVSPVAMDEFLALGGRHVSFGFTNTFDGADLTDTGGVYARWFAERGVVAAIVRPDSYTYGLAHDGAEIASLLERLLATLTAPSVTV